MSLKAGSLIDLGALLSQARVDPGGVAGLGRGAVGRANTPCRQAAGRRQDHLVFRWRCPVNPGWQAAYLLELRAARHRAAARRMASLLGESIGETVGYRMRLDSKAGPGTRVEVVTDGVFTRIVQDDPALDGVGAVLFDEVHAAGDWKGSSIWPSH